MSIRDVLCEMGYEDSIVFDNPQYDNAIIGVSSDGRVVYDYDDMIVCLLDDMNYEEVCDFISYNTMRALDYMSVEKKTIILYKLEEVV